MRNFYAFLCVAIFSGCGSPTRTRVGDGGMNGNCPSGCSSCDPMTGACKDCTPNMQVCQGDSVVNCAANGTYADIVKQCDTGNGEKCAGGQCLSQCEVAASTRSYIGCDYWPVTTLTSQLNPYFDFAVAVANPLQIGDVVQSAPADITVTLGANIVATEIVMPGDVKTIILPWVPEVAQNPDCTTQPGVCTPKNEASVLTADGAYHLVSSIPVTVYQFSPLEFEKPQSNTCVDQVPMGATCHSYSNDASILLPSTAWKNEYIVMSRGTLVITQQGNPQAFTIPGFFTVAAVQDGTTVTVTYSAHNEPGLNVQGQNPGDTVTYMLDAGSVLEVASQKVSKPCAATSSDLSGNYCDLGPNYDLTGTHITSDKPIEVFGGHSCDFVPYNKWACDHIEEQLTPLDTWGQKVVVVQTEPQTTGEPNVWRVLSGSDGNSITFDPPVHAPVTLDTGKFVEFTAQGGFLATGTGRILIGQFMVGENSINDTTTVGDPSLGLGVPVEQFRDNYDFLSPDTYTKNYLDIVAPDGDTLMLDGAPVMGAFTEIGGSGYGYLRVPLMAGAHHVTGGTPFGITVSGIANFTSYLYVGGQNLGDVPLQ